MKRLVLACALLLGSAACAPNAQSIEVLSAIVGPDANCIATPSTTQRTGGFLNVSEAPVYIGAISVKSNMENAPISASGQNINAGARNDFVINEVKLSYSATDSNGAAVALPKKSETLAISASVAAGGTSAIPFDFIPFSVGQGIAQVAPATGRTVVKVSMVLSGKFVNGSSLDTDPFIFPIEIVNPGVLDCPKGKKRVAVGAEQAPCGNIGQDGSFFDCIDDTATP